MLKLLEYLKGYRAAAIAAPLFKIIEAIIELIIPLIVAYMIDVAIAGEDMPLVIGLGALMAGLSCVGLCFSLACQYLASKAAVGMGCNIRAALYSHLHKLDLGDADRIGTGALVNRLSTDVAQAQQGFAMFLRLMLRAPVIAAGGAIMSIIVAPSLWFIGVSAGVLAFAILLIVMKTGISRFSAMQKKLDDISRLTGETIRGERVIRAFAGEKRSKERFDDALGGHCRAAVAASALSCLLTPAATVIVNAAVVVLLWVGGGMVDGGALSSGDLVALVNYLNQILLALITTATLMVLISKAISSAARINAVFALAETREGAGAVPDFSAPLVEMKDAAYSFGGEENAVGGLNITLRRGEILGVIGTTGSGKSTLAGLLARFYVATEGCVRIAGNDIRDYTDEQLRSLVTLAPQKPLLFSGTVRSNLGMSGCTDDGDMENALRTSHAWGFVSEKDGLDTPVTQKGNNFSGGEKQRISLARALLRDAPVLVLDDAASALDYVTEAEVMSGVRKTCRDKAIINISQRIGTIRRSDKVLVLDGGRVMGYGTHEELLRTCGLYRMLGGKNDAASGESYMTAAEGTV